MPSNNSAFQTPQLRRTRQHLVAISIAAALLACMNGSATGQTPNDAGNGFQYSGISIQSSSLWVTVFAQILNQSDRPYQVVRFEITARNRAQQIIAVSRASILNIEPHSFGVLRADLTDLRYDRANEVAYIHIRYLEGW
jgi:hypothetical protein